MSAAMNFFIAGCVAELYLLVVRRFYINGNAVEQIAWYDTYLKVFIEVGAAILILGILLEVLWKTSREKRSIGWSICAVGAVISLSSALVFWNMSVLTLLYVLVPVIMLLGILWNLYDRECALALTVLGFSLIAAWVCRRAAASMYLGTAVKVAVGVYLLLVVLLALAVKLKKLPKVMPAQADPLPVYVACALSVVALAISFISAAVAYYAMWALVIVVFALAVYYTVKQL